MILEGGGGEGGGGEGGEKCIKVESWSSLLFIPGTKENLENYSCSAAAVLLLLLFTDRLRKALELNSPKFLRSASEFV